MISLYWFIGGVVLLFAPLWLLRAEPSMLGGYDQRIWPRGFNIGLSLFDAARATTAAYMLNIGVAGLTETWHIRWWMAECAFGLILVGGVALQMVSWKTEDHFLAPIFYVPGVLLALLHPIVAGIALFLGVGSALAMRAWAAGFIASSIIIAILSLLLHQQRWSIGLVGAIFCASPVLLSVLFTRQLGWMRKPLGTQDPFRD